MLTISQFREALTNPDYIVGFIIANNPEAVADNLRGQGFIVSTPQDIVQALNALLERGDDALFEQALSVPLNEDRITPDELVVLAEQSDAMRRVAGKGGAKSTDWNAILGGLAAGALYYLNSSGTNTVKPTDPNTAPPTPPKKDNTALYVGIGIAVVVLIIILLLVFRKK